MYALYETLSKKIPQEDLSPTQRKVVTKTLTSLEDDRKKSAVVMLIAEHYRLETKKIIDGGKTPLPYEISQTESGIEINITKLPRDLQWVLYKFATLGS